MCGAVGAAVVQCCVAMDKRVGQPGGTLCTFAEGHMHVHMHTVHTVAPPTPGEHANTLRFSREHSSTQCRKPDHQPAFTMPRHARTGQ